MKQRIGLLYWICAMLKKSCEIKLYTLRYCFLFISGISIIHAVGQSDIYNTSHLSEKKEQNQFTNSVPGKPSSSPALSPSTVLRAGRAEGLRGAGICFTPNKGQIKDVKGSLCPDVLYSGESVGADVYLRKTGLSYVYSNINDVQNEINERVEELMKENKISKAEEQQKKDELLQKEIIKIHRVDMEFEGCNQNIEVLNEDPVEGYQNFYNNNCPQGITNVTQYNKLTYKNIYNEIDITYNGDKKNGIKYDLIVQPFADPNQIKLHWKGAERIHVDPAGKLVIKTSVNEFYESIPKVYQIIDGQILDVKTKYILTPVAAGEATVSFSISAYNPSFPLVIDPWATYYGGSDWELGLGIANDPSGNVVITGRTISTNFPILGAFQGSLASVGGTPDAFVVKLNATGNRIWATYYGGDGWDGGMGIAADKSGNIVITGFTGGGSFPVFGGTQMTYGGGSYDAFIVKFNSAGVRIWATFYGGSGFEWGRAIATDIADNIVITGYTSSFNFPALAGFQMVNSGGSYDAFVVKLNSSGLRLWSTYCGGSGNEQAFAIATDFTGNTIITGWTQSNNFPVFAGSGYIQGFGGAGINGDCFIVKLDFAGSLVWSTYYGGSNDDQGWGIATDNFGNVVITGYTGSTDFPVGKIGANVVYQPSYGTGRYNAFVLKFSNAGVRQWATYYGSSINVWIWGIGVAIDANNNIYVNVESEDAAAPNLVDACSYQPVFNGGSSTSLYGGDGPEDQLIVKFSPLGNKICATYMGGTGEDDLDSGGGISIFGNSLYLSGYSNGGYPVTPGAFQTIHGGGLHDAFVASLCINICEGKILGLNFNATTTSLCASAPVSFTPTVANSCDTAGYKFQWTFTGGNPTSSTDRKPSVIYAAPGSYPVKLVLSTACKKDSIIKSSFITVNNCNCVMSATAAVTANVNCSGAPNGSATISISNGSGGPYTYTWSNGVSGITTVTNIPITGLSANTYNVTITEGSCASVSTINITQPVNINSISASNLACNAGNNGSATVVINSSIPGPYTYSWSSGISSITNSFNHTINNLSAGTYTVTINQGSCSATSIVSITQPLPFIVVASTQYSCLTNGTATAFTSNGSSPFSYLWSNGQTTATASGLSEGVTYTVSITDANGCTATTTAIPQIIPIIATTAGTNITCTVSGKASVTVTSGLPPFTFSWSNGNITTINSTNPTSFISGINAGNYTVTITDGNGCTVSKTYTITGSSTVSATFTVSSACMGSLINFTNTGTAPGAGITYYWDITPVPNVSGAIVSGTTTDFSYTFLTAGTYDISHTVRDGTCNSNAIVTINITNCNSPTVTATGSSACPGSCATVTSSVIGGVGPYTYSWSNSATTQNISPCPGTTTTYTVTIKDAGGNTSTSTAVATINPVVTLITSVTNITCNGSTNGSVMATAGNGTPGYSYSWSNGGTTSQISNLPAQIYTVTVTDGKGCTATSIATVISPAPLVGQFTKGTASCAGCGCKEWVFVTVTGGTSPYSYSWPDGYINRYKNQLCPGAYSAAIKDKNGCIVNVNLSVP